MLQKQFQKQSINYFPSICFSVSYKMNNLLLIPTGRNHQTNLNPKRKTRTRLSLAKWISPNRWHSRKNDNWQQESTAWQRSTSRACAILCSTATAIKMNSISSSFLRKNCGRSKSTCELRSAIWRAVCVRAWLRRLSSKIWMSWKAISPSSS